MCSDAKNNFVMPRKIQDKLNKTMEGRREQVNSEGVYEMDLGLYKLNMCFLEALKP